MCHRRHAATTAAEEGLVPVMLTQPRQQTKHNRIRYIIHTRPAAGALEATAEIPAVMHTVEVIKVQT